MEETVLLEEEGVLSGEEMSEDKENERGCSVLLLSRGCVSGAVTVIRGVVEMILKGLGSGGVLEGRSVDCEAVREVFGA